MSATTLDLLERRSKCIEWDPKANDIIFQALHWQGSDEALSNDDDDDEEQGPSYVIKAFGSDQWGHTTSVSILGFTPYFYVKVPGHWTTFELAQFRKYVEEGIRKRNRRWTQQLVSVRFIMRKDFWGFTNFKDFKFVRLCFSTLQCFRYSQTLFETPIKIPHITGTHRYKMYESNIDPYIRFMHIKDIQPCGWIKIPVGKYSMNADINTATTCQIDIECQWGATQPYETDKSSSFLVASFDIECMSHTGDFPVARKDFQPIAYEIVQQYNAMIKARATEYEQAALVVDSVISALGFGVPKHGMTTHPVLQMETVDFEKLRKELHKHTDDLLRVLKDGFKNIQAKKPGFNFEKVAGLLNSELSKIKSLPRLKGDEIIQIGTTFHWYGDKECCFKHIITLGESESFEGADVVCCSSERELLLAWKDMITKTNPDFVIGYNIFGFDFAYLYERSLEVGCDERFMRLGKWKNKPSKFVKKKLSSSALGDNFLEYIDMEGRVMIDIMKVIQRDHKLDSYKLDNVAATFMDMRKNDVSPQDIFRLQKGSAADRRVVAEYCVQDCSLCNYLSMKLEVIANNIGMANVCLVPLSYIFMRGQGIKIFSLVLKQCKDDGFLIPTIQKANTHMILLHIEEAHEMDTLVDFLKYDIKIDTSQVIRELTDGNTGVACIVTHRYHPKLFEKALNRAMRRDVELEMTSVMDFKQATEEYTKHIKRRKIETEVVFTSLDECQESEEEDGGGGYEGAIVLDPDEGIYTDPISVLDYASLYPSSMISENLSHDCIVLDKSYDNLPGYEYLNVTYDLYDGVGDKKKKVGEKLCRFVQLPDGDKGILPRILMKLLKARKSTRKRIQLKKLRCADGTELVGWYNCKENKICTEEGIETHVPPENIMETSDYYNDFQKAVLDGLQLAYKVTANSLYGQMGARTSPLYMKEIAACTTATGRKMIMMAKTFLENEYDNRARVVYGDTDSVFVAFDNRDPDTGEKLSGKAAVKRSIEHAHAASKQFKKYLKAPHDLEYDKTFYPMILLSKKRYVGNLYEEDETKFCQKSMGIVLKRRDNAQIVKRVYGGIIDIILNRNDIDASVKFLNDCLKELIDGKCPLEDLVISKSLRAQYKDPDRIAHKVLADRMGERNPGNKPQANDRIPYVYTYMGPTTSKNKILQGNRIETPDYIREKKLTPDYEFYITNQIMKPVLQLYALVVEKLKGYRHPEGYFKQQESQLLKSGVEAKKAKEKMDQMKENTAYQLLFEPVLNQLQNVRNKDQPITKFFKPTPKLES
jgi:DNA polymerase elongation subunit (family B)